MEIIRARGNVTDMCFGDREAYIINNALNEIVNGIKTSQLSEPLLARYGEASALSERFLDALNAPGPEIRMTLEKDERSVAELAVREACRVISAQEFHTRMGAHLDEVEALLHELSVAGSAKSKER